MLVNTLPNSLPSANAESNFKRLCDVRAETVVYTIAKTVH